MQKNLNLRTALLPKDMTTLRSDHSSTANWIRWVKPLEEYRRNTFSVWVSYNANPRPWRVGCFIVSLEEPYEELRADLGAGLLFLSFKSPHTSKLNRLMLDSSNIVAALRFAQNCNTAVLQVEAVQNEIERPHQPQEYLPTGPQPHMRKGQERHVTFAEEDEVTDETLNNTMRDRALLGWAYPVLAGEICASLEAYSLSKSALEVFESCVPRSLPREVLLLIRDALLIAVLNDGTLAAWENRFDCLSNTCDLLLHLEDDELCNAWREFKKANPDVNKRGKVSKAAKIKKRLSKPSHDREREEFTDFAADLINDDFLCTAEYQQCLKIVHGQDECFINFLKVFERDFNLKLHFDVYTTSIGSSYRYDEDLVAKPYVQAYLIMPVDQFPVFTDTSSGVAAFSLAASIDITKVQTPINDEQKGLFKHACRVLKIRCQNATRKKQTPREAYGTVSWKEEDFGRPVTNFGLRSCLGTDISNRKPAQAYDIRV
ncbi:uncharacterized protein KY384_000494 [Bacidia gigantensis]|uniref:uncharacterized protein n=1 Tax=Bacidia gigantensis TaxID=2732470 RepID=UPI001D046779|nr:uncharacterized protein KY384_000494 [Bacidia gigantensis]KAG8525734.1 hypothetical protein KY384_000494 [Bacidia gigantensis]